jgi:hypothetical protein
MNKEKQRIKIAEACGWKSIGYGLGGIMIGVAPGNSGSRRLPDYPNDLNAMHEAEKVLEGSKVWNRYTEELGKLRHYNPVIHDLRSFANIIVSATAAQRSEAFLKTLGLWEDDIPANAKVADPKDSAH